MFISSSIGNLYLIYFRFPPALFVDNNVDKRERLFCSTKIGGVEIEYNGWLMKHVKCLIFSNGYLLLSLKYHPFNCGVIIIIWPVDLENVEPDKLQFRFVTGCYLVKVCIKLCIYYTASSKAAFESQIVLYGYKYSYR